MALKLFYEVTVYRKLTSGISRNKILDEIRGTLDPSSIPHRVHLLSLQVITHTN